MTNVTLKAGERIDQLFSTDVKIIQNKDVFSYSIDSILLSRFPKIPSRGLIVDLCSGNGAVGLFASTRTKAPIIEVELQERLADMAQRSIQLNHLENQVQMVQDDLKNLLNHVPRSRKTSLSTIYLLGMKLRPIWTKSAKWHATPSNPTDALPWCIVLTVFLISSTPCVSII